MTSHQKQYSGHFVSIKGEKDSVMKLGTLQILSLFYANTKCAGKQNNIQGYTRLARNFVTG